MIVMRETVMQVRGTLPENGAATQILSIGFELLRRGYRVEFVSGGGTIAEQIAESGGSHTTIEALASRSIPSIIRSIIHLRRFILRNDINIVHAHNSASLLLCAMAGLLAGRFRIMKFFLSVHGVEVRRFFWFRNMIFPISQFANFFPVSEYTAFLLSSFGVRRSKMHVTYNGIDLERFDLEKKKEFRREIVAELGIDEDSLIIGLVGRQHGYKGHRDAIRVFSRLYPDFTNLHLVLVGAGDEERSNQELAEHLGVADRVRFMGFRTDVERFHASFDVLSLFSRSGYEMFPCSLLEGMAFAVPFVSVKTTGVPELASDGQGIICECSDLGCYEDSLRMLLISTSERERMGKIGLHAMRTRFNIGAVVDVIEEVYIN
ncbi:glycosyltransferase [Luminiphilus sp.]|nr:glycosyltransferase [Luminiphilus sp.]